MSDFFCQSFMVLGLNKYHNDVRTFNCLLRVSGDHRYFLKSFFSFICKICIFVVLGIINTP